jgi:hypothetical protein
MIGGVAMWFRGMVLAWAAVSCSLGAMAAHPHAAPGITSLTNANVQYEVVPEGYARLRRGPIELVLVDNRAHQLPEAPGHRAGYNGIAVLLHEQQSRTLFVPEYAGLNFEHIHDGTSEGLAEPFEPRVFSMELRRVDEHTYELYQPPTGNFQLESCGRYRLLPDGVIEYTLECVPRQGTFRRGFMGLFWASYIHQPEDLSIWFLGHEADGEQRPEWIHGVTPRHGVDATHPPAEAGFLPRIDADFRLTLVNHPSRYVHTSGWYFGVCRGMAWLQVFRRRDRIWLAQSPSGGGQGNPAWDFQWFVPDCRPGEAYGFVMRAAYVPFENREQIARLAARLQAELEQAE